MKRQAFHSGNFWKSLKEKGKVKNIYLKLTFDRQGQSAHEWTHHDARQGEMNRPATDLGCQAFPAREAR